MKRAINIIIKYSALIAILGGVLFYFGFEAIGCALLLVGSFITLMKLINKRNKRSSNTDYTTAVYGATPWDSSDCSS